jgi:hypothetical protein
MDITSVHENKSDTSLLFCKDNYHYTVSLLLDSCIPDQKLTLTRDSKSFRFDNLRSRISKLIYQYKQKIFL